MLTVLLDEISPGTKGSLLLTCKPGAGCVCIPQVTDQVCVQFCRPSHTEIVALV